MNTQQSQQSDPKITTAKCLNWIVIMLVIGWSIIGCFAELPVPVPWLVKIPSVQTDAMNTINITPGSPSIDLKASEFTTTTINSFTTLPTLYSGTLQTEISFRSAIPRIVIVEINQLQDTDKVNLANEYITLLNFGSSIDMSGWTLMSSSGASYTFQNFILKGSNRVRIRTGQGQNTMNELYWNRTKPRWSSENNKVILKDLWLFATKWPRQKSHAALGPVN